MLQVYAPSQYLLKKEILILTSVSLEALLLLIGEQIVELQYKNFIDKTKVQVCPFVSRKWRYSNEYPFYILSSYAKESVI